jgi:hypothetical protein
MTSTDTYDDEYLLRASLVAMLADVIRCVS